MPFVVHGLDHVHRLCLAYGNETRLNVLTKEAYAKRATRFMFSSGALRRVGSGRRTVFFLSHFLAIALTSLSTCLSAARTAMNDFVSLQLDDDAFTSLIRDV